MANVSTSPRTYKVVQIVDEIPPAGRGKFENPELTAIKATAKANPGRYVEFTTDAKNVTALGGDRVFVTYTNGTH